MENMNVSRSRAEAIYGQQAPAPAEKLPIDAMRSIVTKALTTPDVSLKKLEGIRAELSIQISITDQKIKELSNGLFSKVKNKEAIAALKEDHIVLSSLEKKVKEKMIGKRIKSKLESEQKEFVKELDKFYDLLKHFDNEMTSEDRTPKSIKLVQGNIKEEKENINKQLDGIDDPAHTKLLNDRIKTLEKMNKQCDLLISFLELEEGRIKQQEEIKRLKEDLRDLGI